MTKQASKGLPIEKSVGAQKGFCLDNPPQKIEGRILWNMVL
jgi:hypothetical protein